jgi:hypothetical protein
MQVAFLRSALGAAAIPCPQIDIGAAFSAVINAALGTKATSYKFSPYDNDLDFLLGETPPSLQQPLYAMQKEQRLAT